MRGWHLRCAFDDLTGFRFVVMRPGFEIGRAMKSTKSEWRRKLLAARSAIPPEARKGYVRAITDRARGLECFDGAATVLGYDAIGAEVDPAELMAWAAESGAKLFTPAGMAAETPDWHVWPRSTVAAPSTRAAVDVRRPLVVLPPGVGYDQRGVRLGRGQGFYDRVLASLRAHDGACVVALAFECQVVAELPSDPWDVVVDVIVTERRVLDFGSRAVAPRGAATS